MEKKGCRILRLKARNVALRLSWIKFDLWGQREEGGVKLD